MADSLRLGLLAGLLFLLQPTVLHAEQIAVRHPEGLMHGFLALRTLDGKLLADGEMTQVAEGDRVTDRLAFHFKDGSIYDDTAVFTQRGRFRLLSDHLTQNGPSFKRPMETAIDAAKGEITVRFTDDDGQEKNITQHMDLPDDLGNGILFTVAKHIPPDAPPTTLSYVAATPKPRLVKLVMVPQGEEPVTHGTIKLKAVHFAAKVKIGGLAGLIAPLIGKQPPDTQLWVLDGDAPAFIKSEGPLSEGGPIWRVELSAPAGFP
jgi:hypothetical protein